MILDIIKMYVCTKDEVLKLLPTVYADDNYFICW